jgi:hypothetical protein
MSELLNTTENRITAEQVDQNCPGQLQRLAKLISVHLEKADKYEEKRDQNRTTAGQYLAEAEKACDEGGFTAFREKFLPDLGRTRAYELLQIAKGTKSEEEIKAGNRERVARHRANKAASVTVTDTAEAAATPQNGREIERNTAHPGSGAPTPRGSLNTGDDPVSRFTPHVMELARLAKDRKPSYFVKTGVHANDLARVGKFLMELADLKSSQTLAAGPGISPEQADEGMKAQSAAESATA